MKQYTICFLDNITHTHICTTNRHMFSSQAQGSIPGNKAQRPKRKQHSSLGANVRVVGQSYSLLDHLDSFINLRGVVVQHPGIKSDQSCK